jgi:ketosteroid isomerase-like protein
MRDAHEEIREIVDRETRAWDTQDVDLLLSVFHPDMVWPWPSRYDAHDPAEWRLVLGRFDDARWRRHYEQLFAEWELVHNRRRLVKTELSEQEDGAFAVVDIDTMWRRQGDSEEMRWRGRVCKVYSLVAGEWKMTMHTGALTYPGPQPVGTDADRSRRATTEEPAKRWAEVWARAWPRADAEAIAALYAPEAVFYSHPFRARQSPREYVEAVFAEQAGAECRFGDPIVSGDRAAVDWWGVITATDGSVETVAGTSLLRFDTNGLVVEQRDAWAGDPTRPRAPRLGVVTVRATISRDRCAVITSPPSAAR